MNRPKTPAQKVGEWRLVYRAVLDELRMVPDGEIAGPNPVRPVISGSDMISLHRTAAIVAAMLVGQNVRMPVETLLEPEAT